MSNFVIFSFLSTFMKGKHKNSLVTLNDFDFIPNVSTVFIPSKSIQLLNEGKMFYPRSLTTKISQMNNFFELECANFSKSVCFI